MRTPTKGAERCACGRFKLASGDVVCDRCRRAWDKGTLARWIAQACGDREVAARRRRRAWAAAFYGEPATALFLA